MLTKESLHPYIHRMSFYHLFGKCFYYSPLHLNWTYLLEYDALQLKLEGLGEGGRKLRHYIHNFQQKSMEERSRTVQLEHQEYLRLFHGLNPVTAPRESFYLTESPHKLEECYKNFGYIPNPEYPDHISLELDFLSFMTYHYLELGQKEKYRNAVLNFLDNHLLQWAPEFAEDIALQTNSQFYRAISLLFLDFLRGEKDFVLSEKEITLH